VASGAAPPRAFVAVLVVHLHFPDAGSLKAKRKELAPVKAFLHGRLGAAVSEVDHHDRWQRATLVVALTAGTSGRLGEAADALERWLDARFPAGVRVERTVASLSDLQN
jgi:uncharacterized protein YlxP (DUF503 family)